MNPGLAMFKKRQRLQGGTEEVRYASELPPNDPRWEAFAKALGVNVEELKKKNLPSQFERDYENMAQDLLRRVQERGYGESRLLNEKQADPDLVPIRAPYGRQRYYDPASALGVDPIMAQGGTGEVRDKVPPFYVNGKWWWEREPGLRPMSEMPENEEDLSPEELRREQEDYKRRVRESQYIQAQKGSSNVQYLQGGDSGLNYDPSYPGPDNPKGPGSGVPTQKFFGALGNVGGNAVFPLFGTLVTGPLFSWATKQLQSGMSQNAVQQAVQGYQQQAQQASDRGEAAPAVPDSPTDVSSDKAHHAGVGIDPEGNPADPGEWWSNDFGRWNTDIHGGFPGELGGNTQGGPGLSYGHFGTGFGSGTVGNWSTAIGFGGNLGGSGVVDPTALGGHVGGMSSPMARAALAHYGSGYQFANPSAFGAFTQSSPQEQRHFLPRQNQQKGTSNVGLNLFRRKQMLKQRKN